MNTSIDIKLLNRDAVRAAMLRLIHGSLPPNRDGNSQFSVRISKLVDAMPHWDFFPMDSVDQAALEIAGALKSNRSAGYQALYREGIVTVIGRAEIDAEPSIWLDLHREPRWRDRKLLLPAVEDDLKEFSIPIIEAAGNDLIGMSWEFSSD